MRSAFGNIFNKFPMKQHSFTFSYIQTGDYCNCSYCFTAVVLEVNSIWSCERRVHVSIYISSVRYLLVMLIIQVIIYRVPSYSQPDSLIPSIFNGLFQKKSTPPRRMGSFFNPPSHLDFLKHKTPPPNWISKVEDPPSRLDFREKIKGLNLIYF